jgi:hypothetical protein
MHCKGPASADPFYVLDMKISMGNQRLKLEIVFRPTTPQGG